MAKRCVVNGCKGWQGVGSLLCRAHAGDPAAVRVAHIHTHIDAYRAQPAQYRLVVATVSSDPMMIPLEEGQTVDVLDLDASGHCIVRDEGGNVGFFPRHALLTEDEIYQRFIAEEDVRLAAELEDQKRRQDAESAAYERKLRERMLKKAEEDRLQRAAEAEQRRAEAERLREELEFRRQWEAEQAQKQSDEHRRQREEAERRAREAQERREREAREQKARWDAQEEAAQKAREAAMMPAWKRDLVAKKRAGPGDETVFPHAAPR